MATSSPQLQSEATSSPEPSPEVVVRGRSIQTFPDLCTSGQYYVEQYFSQWSKRRVTCIVPPIPWTVYNRALGPHLKEEPGISAKQRGDNAELSVYKNVFTCGEQYEEPMFLIAQVDFDPDNKTKHTPNVIASFLPAAKQTQLTTASKKMDIDLTILHINIGAILIEIKASANPLVEIGNAVTSLHKAEGFLKLFDESFPVYKVAVFPNCTESLSEHQKAELKRLELKDNFTFCDYAFAIHPEAVSKVLSHFKSVTQQTVCPLNLTKRTDTLLHWLISLKCLVSSTVRGSKISKVTLKDEAVSVAKQVKQTDVKLTQHDVFSKAEQKSGLVRKLRVATEALYLNPEQIAIWDGPKWQILCGIAGTGKTVLIQHKMLELDKVCAPEEQIAVVTTDAVARTYEKFFHLNKASQRVTVISKATALFRLGMGYTTASEMCAYHLFIDEAQNLLDLSRFIFDIGKNKNSARFLWVALDPVQALDKLQITTEQLETELQICSLPPLCHVMRCTPEITHYWSKYLPPACPIQYNQGNRLFVQDVPVYYAESNENAMETVYSLLETYVDGENITYSDCAVLIHSPPLAIIPIRRKLLEKLGFSERDYLLSQSASEDIITIKDLPNDIWSLEWTYVFIVGQDAKLFPIAKELEAMKSKVGYWDSAVYLAASRCKVQLFLISLEKGRRINVDLQPMFVKPSRVTYSFN